MPDNNDNWSQLLSDFGIDEPEVHIAAEKPALQAVAAENPTADELSESAAKTLAPKERKSFFSRFPKIGFLSSSPKESAVPDTTPRKSAFGNKSFTDNTIERVPGFVPKETGSASNAFNDVVSQIDRLADKSHRIPASMFDEDTPRSEEETALQNLLGKPSEQRRETPFPSRGRSERKDDVPSRRERFQRTPEIDDDTWQEVSTDEPVSNEQEHRQDSRRQSRGRGRKTEDVVQHRVVRHDIDDIPDRYSESASGARNRSTRDRGRDAGQQIAKPQNSWQTNSAPAARNTADTEYTGSEPEHSSPLHRNMPGWDDAIGDIIAANIARHSPVASRPNGRQR